MDPFSLLESWLIREAGFWILTSRKETDPDDLLVQNCDLAGTSCMIIAGHDSMVF